MVGIDVRTAQLESLDAALDALSSQELLTAAEELIQSFIAANFVGYADASSKFAETLLSEVCFSDEYFGSELAFHFNRPFKFARLKGYVWLAKKILIDRGAKIESPKERIVWSSRCVQLWQSLLDEPAEALREIVDRLESEMVSLSKESDRSCSEFWLEMVYSHLRYFECDKAEECLKRALAALHLRVELSGVLGKRTRFQQTNIAQLVTNISSEVDGGSKLSEEVERWTDEELPTVVQLNDDTLLEGVRLAEGGEGDRAESSALAPAHLAAVLAVCAVERKLHHGDELAIEKCHAYVDEVISQSTSWSVLASALVVRCELEKHRSRRVERACSQAELIARLLDGPQHQVMSSKKTDRVRYVLATGMLPFWRVNLLHAAILRSLGCTAEALRVYERFESWDNVIDCFKCLGQLEKAEHLVRELIEKDTNNPLNYCLLGDITLQTSYYEKAIEVSEGRCARAFRSLGNLLLSRMQYEGAFDNLQRSLQLQPIQLGAWFNVGHCAWKLERYNEAVKAYHRCVQLEPEHFEAWNNLSAAYIRLGQKERARKIMQEALKFSYDNANMWENYLLLCVDTHEFSLGIQAFHRLLDLKKRQEDDQVIEIMSTFIADLPQEAGDTSSNAQLRSEMCKLLGRITSMQTSSAKVWRCYALLKKPSENSSVEQYEEYLRLSERAFSADYNKQNWKTEEESCVRVLEGALLVAEARMKICEMKGGDEDLMRSQIRMSLRPLILLTEKTHGVDPSSEVLKENLKKLKEMLRRVTPSL